MSDNGDEPENEPLLVLQARFYFPPGTTFEDAERQVSARLVGLDHTSVMQEIPAEERSTWMAGTADE